MWSLLVGLALAAPSAELEESLSGFGKGPKLAPDAVPVASAAPALADAATRGAAQLAMDRAFVAEIQAGVDRLYRRDYDGARAQFAAVDRQWPDSGLPPAAEVLILQAQMLENFDFRYDAAYWKAAKASRSALDRALAKPGNEAWEHFLYGGMVGVEAIHTIRKGSYLSALQLAFEALGHIQQTRESAPDFVDLQLADGMYNYWRSVITENSSVLPSFGDKRAEGFAQMKAVEVGGIFLGPAAALSLTFSHLEEGQYPAALAACQRNRVKYPKNVINNLMTGTVYLYLRDYPNALGLFGEVRATDPGNVRVRYWEGVAHLRSGALDAADTDLREYLLADHLEDWQRSAAWWRLGQVQEKKRAFAAADAAFNEAVKIDGHAQAKAALEALRAQKRRGVLTY